MRVSLIADGAVRDGYAPRHGRSTVTDQVLVVEVEATEEETFQSQIGNETEDPD